MFSTLRQWGIWLSFGMVVFCLPAAQAHAQGKLQARQNARCQHTVRQTQFSGRQRLNALQSTLQTQLLQLNALQQSAQLTPAQLQAVSQLQNTYQNALQQLAALQNDMLTAAQVRTLLALQLGAATLDR